MYDTVIKLTLSLTFHKLLKGFKPRTVGINIYLVKRDLATHIYMWLVVSLIDFEWNSTTLKKSTESAAAGCFGSEIIETYYYILAVSNIVITSIEFKHYHHLIWDLWIWKNQISITLSQATYIPFLMAKTGRWSDI